MHNSPKWLFLVLADLQLHAARGRVRFTDKARRELKALGLGLDEIDGAAIVGDLTAQDFFRRLVSDVSGEWMYEFKPEVCGLLLYIKVVLREHCAVVSFHEDEEEHDEDSDE